MTDTAKKNAASTITPEETARWLPVMPNPQAAVRVFCFAYAGGGPTVFRGWQEHFPVEQVQLCPIALPGREKRLGEPLVESITNLADSIFQALLPFLHQPYVLSGLCFGASLAFEVARQAVEHGVPPRGLMLTGGRAPHTVATDQVESMSEDEFVALLKRLQFVPEVIFNTPDLLELFMPMLRVDFAIDASYVYSGAKPQFSFPITVMYGESDTVTTRESVTEWELYSAGQYTFKEFPGNQLFFTNDLKSYLEFMEQKLREDRLI